MPVPCLLQPKPKAWANAGQSGGASRRAVGVPVGMGGGMKLPLGRGVGEGTRTGGVGISYRVLVPMALCARRLCVRSSVHEVMAMAGFSHQFAGVGKMVAVGPAHS